jgi:hypothetical protein
MASILPENELEELRKEMPQIQNLLENDLIARDNFFKNPFLFLRRKFNLFIIARIADFKELISSFNRTVITMFQKLKSFFDSCFACKFSCVILIYGVLAKLSIPVELLFEKIDSILEVIETFFKGTGKKSNFRIKKIKNLTDQIRPSTLALRFCIVSEYCEDSNSDLGE